MTAILGVFDAGALLPSERVLHASLVAAGGEARAKATIHIQPGAALGIIGGPAAQELGADCTGFAADDDHVVLVDGTFYYLDDLHRALGRRTSTSATTGELLLDAFRSFGTRCVDHLEGDFAFLVWNRHTREVFCARDFTGRRALFLAEWSGGLVAASSLDSLAALPGFDPEINVEAVGADAAGLFFALDDQTCMHGVSSLRSGHSCIWSPGKHIRSVRTWFPTAEACNDLSFGDAALALRDLIARAASERMGQAGPTAVWMSGGRDSTAVFAAAKFGISGRGDSRSLVPISRSHPVGDSGREDEAIEEICRFWRVTPTWVDARSVPLFDGLRNRDRWSSESFAQPFEGLARALATATSSMGAGVALDGYGGDFLFQVSRVYLADMVSRGQIGRAIGDWRAMDGGREGMPGFFRYGVQPLMPRWAKVARRGRMLRGSMERPTPPWINTAFEREHSLTDRFPALGPDAQSGSTAVDREAQFYLTHQFFGRVNARMFAFASDQGVELRSPLLDSRVVRFALSRPREEKNTRGDNKRLLRASMKDLLPASVLAPRRGKAGTLSSYFSEHMRTEGVRQLTQ
ncbi:MAG TPA: asparagine synthase-related protein, partial [Gemmatimonadaceae bacterium]|nr:asparagine synthase-related protein [Gemmatimonadaceae bacterium]